MGEWRRLSIRSFDRLLSLSYYVYLPFLLWKRMCGPARPKTDGKCSTQEIPILSFSYGIQLHGAHLAQVLLFSIIII